MKCKNLVTIRFININVPCSVGAYNSVFQVGTVRLEILACLGRERWKILAPDHQGWPSSFVQPV